MVAEVKTERHADLPAPRSEVGVVGWMYHNLFSSWFNGFLTLAAIALVLWLLPPLIIDESHIDEALDILERTCSEMER